MRVGIVVVALVIAVVVFHGAFSAGFVWDDNAQIARNVFLRDGGRFWQAVTSDVWGFEAEQGPPRSDYWRPLFVLWLMLNHGLFDLEPAGWHVACVLLHCAVLVLAAEALRRLRVALAVSAAVVWLFAVHPVHTESVVWISGSTDPLLALFLLGSYVAWLASRPLASRLARTASWLLFALALLTKETAVLFPVLIFASEWALTAPDNPRCRAVRGVRAAAPHAALVAVYLLVRLAVLGRLASPAPEGPGVITALLTVPRLAVAYLHHLFWPANLAPVYAIRPVTADSLSLTGFVLPLVATSIAAAIGIWLWRLDPVSKIAITLSVVFLLPAMNVAVLSPGRLVHDRYLYLPSLGALLLVVHALSKLTSRRVLLSAAGILAAVLSVATVRYTRAWTDDIALWERAVAASPTSAFALANLGYHYREAGRDAEARHVLARALEVDPGNTQAQVDLGLVALSEGRHADAERSFRTVLAAEPDHEVALERLALVYLAQNRLLDAVGVFDETRRRLPRLTVRSTVNMGALLLQLERPGLALAELQSIAGDLANEEDPRLLAGYWYMGEACLALERTEDARGAYQRYLRETEGAAGAMVEDLRVRAADRLVAIGRQ